MQLQYRPVFLRGQETANTYRCVLATESGTPDIQALMHEGDDIAATADRNAFILGKAFVDLAYVHGEGVATRLIVPVNAKTLLESDSATVLVTAFRQLNDRVRKAVIVEVFDFPDNIDMDLDTLADITIPLLPFFDFYIARPASDVTDFTVFVNSNYFGIGLDLETMEGPPEQTLKTLNAVAIAAKKRKLKLFVQGVTNEDMAQAVNQHDPFAKDGPFLATDISVPGAVAKTA